MCVFVLSSICAYKLIRCSFIITLNSNPVPVTFQAKWGRKRGWENEKGRETQLECKRQNEQPLFFKPLEWEAITFEATTHCVQIHKPKHIQHTHMQIWPLFWLVSVITWKVESWIKEALISVLIVCFSASTFECLCLTVHYAHSSTVTSLTLQEELYEVCLGEYLLKLFIQSAFAKQNETMTVILLKEWII